MDFLVDTRVRISKTSCGALMHFSGGCKSLQHTDEEGFLFVCLFSL